MHTLAHVAPALLPPRLGTSLSQIKANENTVGTQLCSIRNVFDHRGSSLRIEYGCSRACGGENLGSVLLPHFGDNTNSSSALCVPQAAKAHANWSPVVRLTF